MIGLKNVSDKLHNKTPPKQTTNTYKYRFIARLKSISFLKNK